MTHIITHCAPAPRRAAPLGLVARLSQMIALWRQRSALRDLDDARLCDMGITRAEAEAEARRPVWDVPTHWQR
ncbi:DUF1127 domain-containing protein [Loktanella sp. IMCC34160]|uniref:DUF1127 domain-containing protein n=1 Tax=Loktanella sp. IMCC34160 TaxID=2510646 RepID=UPI00101C92AA|nr:DUF1127 domain-containing protein [Loktanella sp. IMCC34160]RYG93070.1 DUF1127 domain-containing protein [Loktanella sp. IMCC34160]